MAGIGLGFSLLTGIAYGGNLIVFIPVKISTTAQYRRSTSPESEKEIFINSMSK